MNFINARTMSTILELMFSSHLAGSSTPAFSRHVRLSKLLIRDKCVLSLLDRLKNDATSSKCHCVTHQNDAQLFMSSDEDISVLKSATEAYSKKATSRSFI